MTKIIPLILCLLSSFAAAQDCKTFQLLPISAIAKQDVNTCVRTVGSVTFVRKFGDQFRFEVTSATDESIMVTSTEEPYTGEDIEVWGSVDNSVVNYTETLESEAAPAPPPLVGPGMRRRADPPLKITKKRDPVYVKGLVASKILVITGALPSRTGKTNTKPAAALPPN